MAARLPPDRPVGVGGAVTSVEATHGRSQAGTITFLFTDIEGGGAAPCRAAAAAGTGTRRWEQHPESMEVVLARVKALSAEQINARIADMFRLLTGGSRTALPRQQTLRAAIDWSYDLLSDKEKILLRRRRAGARSAGPVPEACGTFAGGWTLEAAEQVCADPEE